jgi:hypothetical protein
VSDSDLIGPGEPGDRPAAAGAPSRSRCPLSGPGMVTIARIVRVAVTRPRPGPGLGPARRAGRPGLGLWRLRVEALKFLLAGWFKLAGARRRGFAKAMRAVTRAPRVAHVTGPLPP